MMEHTKGVYYKDYLRLDDVLNAQFPESELIEREAHDEMLFIIIHQTYEMWFKQIRHELGSVMKIFAHPIAENSPDLPTALHRLQRIVTILDILVQQISILETMTPLDFLDFRNLLRPASGFQSLQFKIVESSLGLKMEHRVGREYFLSQLRPEDAQIIRDLDQQPSLLYLINNWLERMPFFDEAKFWKNYHPIFKEENNNGLHAFWNDYRQLYAKSLVEGERNNLEFFDQVFLIENDTTTPQMSADACRSALFIMLYRDYPLLQVPYRLLNTLLDIDEKLATWRFRHVAMVQRTIGTRMGTGGSTGAGYLRGALDKHYIFSEITQLTSFMIERRNLPILSAELQQELGFFVK